VVFPQNNAAAAQGAIVCLARGYRDSRGYDQLIARNRSIFETINRRRSHQYPLIIWHEGNISSEHQRYILAEEANRDVRFVDISLVFRAPDWVAGGLPEHWRVGYRLMCRFHSYNVWQTVKGSSTLCVSMTTASLARLRLIRSSGWLLATAISGPALSSPKTHALTNRTLPLFVTEYMKVLHPSAARAVDLYNQVFLTPICM
jgi:hypothetical protein